MNSKVLDQVERYGLFVFEGEDLQLSDFDPNVKFSQQNAPLVVLSTETFRF
jgi:hypothetical protein